MKHPLWRLGTSAGIVVALAGVGAKGVQGVEAAPGWTIVTTVNPGLSDGDYQDMYAVACTAADACEAVGYRDSFGTKTPMAQRWDGSTWAVQDTPAPPATRDSYFNGVSCSSADACTAIGTGFLSGTSGGKSIPLVERWNGSRWDLQRAPVPPGSLSTGIIDVSCTGAAFCSAVGYSYVDAAGDYVTLAMAWNGTTWTIQPTPNPPGGGYLTSVACVAPAACTALGGYYNTHGIPATFAERWNGSRWLIDTTPNPVGSAETDFNKVSCTAATACAAVGEWRNQSGTWMSLAERWDGSQWTIQPTPDPAASTMTFLYSVSCPAAKACVATGFYRDHNGMDKTVVERWNGSSWVVQDSPNAPHAQVTSFFSVWCVAVDRCMAVGSLHPDNSGPHQSFAEVYR